MTPKNALKELGLSDQESDVYVSLLRTGGAIASVVAKDVGLKRTTVYPILKAMARKGFVTTFYRKSKQYYQKKTSAFLDVIPTLQSLEKKHLKMVGLRFIETLDELKHFYDGILDQYKGKQYCIIGSATEWQGLDEEYFIEYRRSRAAHKIKTRLLLAEATKEDNPDDPSLLRDVRWLGEKYTFKSTIDIFKDKVLIVSPELSSLAVVIAIPAMVDVFQAMFDMMWDVTG
jgi:predicted transcriptional regulator